MIVMNTTMCCDVNLTGLPEFVKMWGKSHVWCLQMARDHMNQRATKIKQLNLNNMLHIACKHI
jgi:hypothetical protein